ncbi:hypothetical protein C4577_03590 [Candidatus Parcubacteria bacterium]|nr:MAG: hypothetical protein C4577_03590 [Candidatus Parcubacteria bacterium]
MPIIIKVCEFCSVLFNCHNPKRRFCGLKCSSKYSGSLKKGKKLSQKHRERLSVSAKRRNKWVGKDNPNYQNKTLSREDVYNRWKKSMKIRGQPWGEKERKEHSERMLGPTNGMRGKSHTDKYKRNMSELKIQQYKDGIVKFRSSHSSKAELEVGELLNSWGLAPVPQFQIRGFTYFYDFYIPSLNLILEFNGDYWHANPNKYKSGTLIKFMNQDSVLVDEVWERDSIKTKTALDNGFKIVVLWENEFMLNGEKALRGLLKI